MALKFEHTFSQLPRQALCPGSARMEHGLPSERSSYSDEGTRLHQAMHDGPGSPIDRALTEEQAWLVNRCRELPKTYPYDVMENWCSASGLCEGRPDFVSYGPEGAEVWDWKFGNSGIDPGTVWQIKGQLLAVAEWLLTSSVIVTAYAPRTNESLVVKAENEEQLAEIWDEVAAVVNASETPDALLAPSQEACKYCKALSFCEGAAKEVSTYTSLPEPSELSVAQLSRALDVRSLFTKWSEAVYKEAKAFRGSIPGWTRGTREGDRYIADVVMALSRVSNLVDTKDVLQLMTLPYGKFSEFVIGRLREQGMTEKLAAEQFATLMQGIVERGAPITTFRKEKESVRRISSHSKKSLDATTDGASSASSN